MDLEELKLKNAETETDTSGDPAETVEEVEEEVADEETEETEESGESQAEENSEDAEEPEVEEWMKADDQTSEDNEDKKFTDGDAAAMRRKFKAAASEQKDEIELLKAENEKLRQSGVSAQTAGVAPEEPPKLSDPNIDFDEDKYAQAMLEYSARQVNQLIDKRLNTDNSNQQIAQNRQKIESSLDSHYQRVEKMAKVSNIDAETYKNAELKVRRMLDKAYPDGGDAALDEIIHRLGPGSEKIVINLGISAKTQSEFSSKLAEDPTGLSAIMYLGEKKAEFNSSKKTASRAPKPAKNLTGGKGGNVSKAMSEVALRKAYDKSTDVQEKLNFKFDARAKGYNVSGW